MPSDQPFAFREADLWRDAHPAPAPFAGALVPSPEHLFLHACVHFAWQHTMTFGAWRTFRLIGLVERLPGFDWDRLTRVGRDANAATACYWSLRLAERMSGIPAPSGIMSQFAPPTPAWVRRALERHLVTGIALGEGPASPSVALTRWLWRAALRPRWSGHPAPGRWDPEQRWVRARGMASAETSPARVVRHVRAFRDWWAFLSGTLFR
jgi:hypothetical protein